MPTYKSVNDSQRVYPTLGLVIEPDETIELEGEVDAAGLVLVDAVQSVKVAKATVTKGGGPVPADIEGEDA